MRISDWSSDVCSSDLLAVDAQVRFSWIMLGREPRSTEELLMVYAGIMAHGTSLTAAECARMIPQLSATSIRQAMRRSEEHTSELQSLMRISYAVFCLKKKTQHPIPQIQTATKNNHYIA